MGPRGTQVMQCVSDPWVDAALNVLNPARGLGERCKLPQWGLGGSPTEIEFGAFLVSNTFLGIIRP